MAINKSKIVAQAQKYASKGHFEKAVAEYQKVLKEEPNDIRTWLKLGDIYTRMGARREATDTYLRVAEQYTQGGFYLKAVAVYKQIIKLDPLLTQVFELLADSYISLGLTSEALIQYEQLVDVAARQGKTQLLVKTLERIVELDEGNVTMRLRLAEQLSANGSVSEAVIQFKKACDQLLEVGRGEDFLKVAERLLYHDNTQVDIARKAARMYIDREQPKRALGKLQACFAMDRHDPKTLEMLGQAFLQLGQPDKAVSVYKELVGVGRSQGDQALVSRFEAEIKRLQGGGGNGDTSAPAISDDTSVGQEVGSESTTKAAAVSKLLDEAEVLIKYGLIERTREHFEKIFALDYYNMDARERLKDVLREAGDMQGAKEQLFVLVDAFAQSQPEGAVYYLHQILEIDPYSRRARKRIEEIGGMMPDGLPPLDEEEQTVESGLLSLGDVTEGGLPDEISVEADFDVKIDDIPYVEDDADAQFLIDEDSVAKQPISVTPAPPAGPVGLPRPSLPPVPGASMPPASIGLPKPSMVPPGSLPKPSISPPSHLPTPSMAPSADANAGGLKKPGKTVSPRVDLTEEIEEIEFFLEQGLAAEGRAILVDLLDQYPADEQLLALKGRFADIDDDVDDDGPSIPGDGLGELSSALNLDDISEDDHETQVDAVFSQFKAGVEQQISRSDHSTHYDLGQAYKEMGLWDDAIGEFKIAAGDAQRRASAEMMVGMCHVGAGRLDDAIGAFNDALGLTELDESERLALMYEKAKVYELLGKPDKAIDLYNDILNTDPGFADVVDRIDALE